MLTSSNADPAFTKCGFSNWKNTMEKRKKAFQKHESSDSHMEAVVRYVTAPATVIGDIGDLLSERHALEKSKKDFARYQEETGTLKQSLISYTSYDSICDNHRIEFLFVCPSDRLSTVSSLIDSILITCLICRKCVLFGDQ